MAGANSRLVSAREMYSNSETLSDAADDIRCAADVLHNERLTAIAHELDNIAAAIRLEAANKAHEAAER
jgi:hypothetical protein